MYYTTITWQNVIFYIVYNEEGIHAIHSDFSKIRLYGGVFKEHSYVQEVLTHYFQGGALQSTPLVVKGSPFQKSVWEVLRSIPYGEIRTYSQIAEAIGKPQAVRAIAHAIAQNPILLLIPCHRVIGKDGKLTGYSGGLELKKKLLEAEMMREKALRNETLD